MKSSVAAYSGFMAYVHKLARSPGARHNIASQALAATRQNMRGERWRMAVHRRSTGMAQKEVDVNAKA